ncbi:MAG: ferredoxin [Planctomycetes bacterium]|jgi:ferredoxin|nr:ferredoxin [Planctomycetota bacterium]
MKATVDETCISCGLCVEICPEVFELPDTGIAKVKVATVPEESWAACREAAASCPVDAIHIEE